MLHTILSPILCWNWYVTLNSRTDSCVGDKNGKMILGYFNVTHNILYIRDYKCIKHTYNTSLVCNFVACTATDLSTYGPRNPIWSGYQTTFANGIIILYLTHNLLVTFKSSDRISLAKRLLLRKKERSSPVSSGRFRVCSLIDRDWCFLSRDIKSFSSLSARGYAKGLFANPDNLVFLQIISCNTKLIEIRV